MAISYVGGVKGGRAGSTSTTTQSLSGTLTGGSASSPSPGDLVVVWVSAAGNSSYKPTSQTVSGNNSGAYTYETFQSSADTYYSLSQLNYKIQGATVDTSLTIPASGNARCAQRWVVHVFRGVRAADILDVSAVPKTGIDTGRPNPDSITPTTAGAWIVAYYASATATTGTAYTAASGLSGWLGGTSNDTYACMQGGGYYSSWTSGAYDPAAITAGGTTGSDDAWTAMTIALRPEHAPTVALGTPADNASISDSTPDLKFTGTDGDSDTLDYQVQVDTSTSFNSQTSTITNDTSAKSITTGYAGGGAFNSSYTCGANATLLVVSVGLWQDVAGTGTVSGITYNGAALTQAKYLTNGAMRSEIWYLSSPTTGSSCTLSVTISGDTDQRDILVSSWNGVSTSSPLGNTGSGSGSGSPISHSITQGTAGSLLVDSAVKYGTEAVTKGTSQTLLQSDNATSISAGSSYEVNSSTGSYTLSWTTTGSNDWSHTSAEFKAGTAPLVNALSTGHTGFSAGTSHPTASGAEQTYTVGDYDNFNDNSFDAIRWTRSNASQVTEQNAELELASTAAAGYYFATSAQKINLTGRIVSLKWVDEGNTAITSYEAYPLELTLDANNKFSIYNTSGTVYCRKTVGGSPTTLFNEAYSATGHLYLRIRESSGTVYFDKSSDGATWVNMTSTSVASSFAVTSLDLVITVGTWQVEGSTTIMKIDDVKYGYELADGTYYWRVRAIDPSGSNTWGAWSPGDSTLGYDHFHLSSGTVNGSVTQVAASLTLTGGTQSVVGLILANASVTQTGASLTLSGGTQTVASVRIASVTQSAASLTLTGGTQVVASTQIGAVAQTAASLTLSSGTQSIASVQNSAISQTAASLTLSAGTQSVTAVVMQNASVTQSGAPLVLSGGTQTVAGVIIADAAVTQVSASLALSAGTQAINATQVSNISQTAASLTLTGGTQVVEGIEGTPIENASVTQISTSMTLSTGTQVIEAVEISNASVTQVGANLTLSSGTQQVASNQISSISQVGASLTLSGGTQSVASTQIASINQTSVSMYLTGGTQSVEACTSASITQVGASLVLSGGTQSIATIENVIIQQIAAQLSLSSGTQSVVSVSTGVVTQVGANLIFSTGTPVISTSTGPLPTYYPDIIFCDGKLAIQLDGDQYIKI